MKKTISIALFVYAVMLLLPLVALGKDAPIEEKITVTAQVKEEKTNNLEKSEVFRVLDKKSGEITEISVEDYVFGVVAAEMPASYEIEALKAQAVAAYTYACYKRENAQTKEYDITTDFTVDQSYKTKEQAITDWGENSDQYVEKIENAVKETEQKILVYDGKPILAVYHALSCGNTYSAKDVWNKDIPYLQSVTCADDKLAKNYVSSFTFTEKELAEKFSENDDFEEKSIIGERKTAKSGIVTSLEAFGKEFSGNEVRNILNLPSSNFSCKKDGEKYIFSVNGYGHGVGMSQNGANSMAKQGYDFEEILMHFYTGTKLKK